MNEFGYLVASAFAADDQMDDYRKDSLKLRPLVLPSILAHSLYSPVQRLNISSSRSVPSFRAIDRRVSPSVRMTQPRDAESASTDTESGSDSDFEMRTDRRRALTTHEVVFDCLSPQQGPSGQAAGSSSPTLARSRSETFSFPLPPSDRTRVGGRTPSIRRRPTMSTASAVRLPASMRSASFRADAEAFINQISPCLPLTACTFSPMQWPASLALNSGSQGWSPDSSRAASPVIFAAEAMEKSDSKVDRDVARDVVRPQEDELIYSPISSDRSERTLPPSYQQASQLPAYKDQKSSPPSLVHIEDDDHVPGEESSAESSDGEDGAADAHKLARLHASFHLLDDENELPLSSSGQGDRAAPGMNFDHVLSLSVEEQMAFLCGMGYRYNKPTVSHVSSSLADSEELSDYDGERAEVGSSWSSSHDSEETRVDHSPVQQLQIQQLQRRQPALRFGPEVVDRRLASNATSARSSPILSGELSAAKAAATARGHLEDDFDRLSFEGDDDDSMPSTPKDAAFSPLGPNEIDVRRLCADPLACNTPSPRFDGHVAESVNKQEKVAGTPMIMDEFSYLVDDSLTWNYVVSPAMSPREEKASIASHLCDNPFDAPLTTPELMLDGCSLDPMEALPSPVPFGTHPLVDSTASASAAPTNSYESEPGPLSHPTVLTRSITCPAGFEQESNTTFEMVPQFHRPFAAAAVSSSTSASNLLRPPLSALPRSTTTMTPTRPPLPASASTSVLSRPRPLGRQHASSFFAATNLQATELKLAKARSSRNPAVPTRLSSLDLRGGFDKAGRDSAGSEAKSYFSSDSEPDDEDDDVPLSERRNSDPSTSKRTSRTMSRLSSSLATTIEMSASFPNPHMSMGTVRAASMYRRNAASRDTLSTSDLSKARDMSVRYRDLLAASSLAATVAQTRRRSHHHHRRRDGHISWSGSEESEPEKQGTYCLSSSAHTASLPTLYVARTDAQRTKGVTGLDETEPQRIREVERYVAARKAGKEVAVRPIKVKSRSSRVRALFGAPKTTMSEERSVVRLNTPRNGVLIVEEKWVEIV